MEQLISLIDILKELNRGLTKLGLPKLPKTDVERIADYGIRKIQDLENHWTRIAMAFLGTGTALTRQGPRTLYEVTKALSMYKYWRKPEIKILIRENDQIFEENHWDPYLCARKLEECQ